MTVTFRVTFVADLTLLGASCITAPTAFATQGGHSDGSTIPSFENPDTNHVGGLVRGENPKDVEALKQLRATSGRRTGMATLRCRRRSPRAA